MPHSLNCSYYCDCRWKTVFKTVMTSAEATSLRCPSCPPRPSRPAAAWRSPLGRGLLQNAAESNLSSTVDVGGTHCGSAASELPGRLSGHARPRRPRPRPSLGERRRSPCSRWLLPRATPPPNLSRRVRPATPALLAGSPAPPPGCRWAPHRRRRCLGARRNEAQMKFLSSLDLYVWSSLNTSLLLIETLLNL